MATLRASSMCRTGHITVVFCKLRRHLKKRRWGDTFAQEVISMQVSAGSIVFGGSSHTVKSRDVSHHRRLVLEDSTPQKFDRLCITSGNMKD